MKRVSLFGMLVLIVSAAYYFLSEKEVVLTQTPQILNAGTRKLFLGTRKKLNSSNIVVTSDVDACADLTTTLESIDFNLEVEDWVKTFDQESFNQCDDPKFKNKIELIKKYCFGKIEKGNCSQQAVFLRAILRTNNITDTEDRDLLADMVLKEFADNNPDFKKLELYSEKLMSFDPDQPAFQKLWASSKIISSLGTIFSPEELTETILGKVSEEVMNDPEMQSLKLALATGLEPGNVEEYARGYLSQKQDSHMHEILGWSLWKQNRYAEAAQELKRAIQMNPQDPWLREQVKNILSKEANSDSYQARLSLGINLQDLYN